ncbi:MAG: hypothetical protein LBQ13_01410 [Endomicrobium sp.]|jgi:hypothetical protein|nr:hypothetical protein [Endomicrobium sp.]
MQERIVKRKITAIANLFAMCNSEHYIRSHIGNFILYKCSFCCGQSRNGKVLLKYYLKICGIINGEK